MPITIARPTLMAAGLGLFLTGLTTGVLAGRQTVSPALYTGKAPEEAARALLDVSRRAAEDGSWENIYIGRTYYHGGMKEDGQRILEEWAARPKAEASDLFRIGKAYADAGDWEKARPHFERVLTMAPKDTDWLVEIGTYYNLNGDRAKAEEIFGRAFAKPTGNPYNIAKAAGSYVGVKPQ